MKLHTLDNVPHRRALRLWADDVHAAIRQAERRSGITEFGRFYASEAKTAARHAAREVLQGHPLDLRPSK